MPEPIDASTVEQVARLARIELAPEALADSSQQLAAILDYVSQLESVDLPEDVEPFFGAIESVNAIREDVVADSSPREVILGNAPDSDGEFYRVPPVFK